MEEKEELEYEAEFSKQANNLVRAGLTEKTFAAMVEAHLMLKANHAKLEEEIDGSVVTEKRLGEEIEGLEGDIDQLRHQLQVSEDANKFKICPLSDTRLRLFWHGHWYFLDETKTEVQFTLGDDMGGTRYHKAMGGQEFPLRFQEPLRRKDALILFEEGKP